MINNFKRMHNGKNNKKTILSLAVAYVFSGIAHANLSIPQHRSITVDLNIYEIKLIKAVLKQPFLTCD